MIFVVDSGSSKTKTQYDMAVTHIKAAKNLEKKGKLDKAKQKYKKAQKLEQKARCPRKSRLFKGRRYVGCKVPLSKTNVDLT